MKTMDVNYNTMKKKIKQKQKQIKLKIKKNFENLSTMLIQKKKSDIKTTKVKTC